MDWITGCLDVWLTLFLGVSEISLLESVNWEKWIDLCNLDGHHLIYWGPEWHRKVEKGGFSFCLTTWVAVAQASLTDCNPKDCSPPDAGGPSVHGILQARVLEWVAIPFSRGSFQPRGWTWFSHFADRFFSLWATREAQKGRLIPKQGHEPWALRLKVWCSTDWAIEATT